MKLKNKLALAYFILLANLLKIKKPLSIWITLTNRCTSNCIYCDFPFRKTKELTTKQIFNLVGQLKKIGTRHINLYGGEPLLRDDIGKIINYIKSKDIFISMSTNGHLVPSKIQEIKNVDLVLLSLDGPEDVHDFHRGKGSFKKTIRAIEILKQFNIPIWTTTVLTQKNIGYLDYILDFAKKHSLLTNYNLLNIFPLYKKSKKLLPTNEEYRKVIKKLYNEKRNNAPIGSSFTLLDHLFYWDDYSKYQKFVKKPKIKCLAGKFYCYIDTDGTVYPCPFIREIINSSFVEKNTKFLNFKDVGLKKAFENCKKGVKCDTCLWPCTTERNLIFSFNISRIKELLRVLH